MHTVLVNVNTISIAVDIFPELMVSTETEVCILQGGHIVCARLWPKAVTTTPLIAQLALIVTEQSTVSNASNNILITACLEADVPQALVQENVGDLLLVAAVQVLIGPCVQAGVVLAVEVVRSNSQVSNLTDFKICIIFVQTI